MSTFKEITKNILTNNGEAISGRLVYTWLGGNESKPVYFGLKDDAGSWAGNLSTIATSGFYLTSNVSGCTALVKYDLPTNIDINTAREIWLNIPKTATSRTIQFSYNGITVLTVKQEITQKTKNKLLICKPTWYYQSTASTPIIGFSTSNTKINVDVFHDYAVPDLNKWLCVTEQLNNPNSVHWNSQQIKTISSLKYIEGTDLKNSIYSDYFLINIYKVYDSNNNSIIEEDFDKITNIGLLYIFEMTNEGAKNIGSVTMRKEGTYMLGEIG